MKLVLFDPSLKNNEGALSDNLGDVIIYDSVKRVLAELFPGKELYRVATHTFPTIDIRQNIFPNDICFLGGTNILNSTVNSYNNWKYDQSFFKTLVTKRTHVITLGVGWGEYQAHPGFYSRQFYSRRLDASRLHSVRDSYSASQLQKISSLKVLNTGCPSTWWLDGTPLASGKTKAAKNCIFTLTDYSKQPEKDEALLNKLLAHFEKLIYFPQGSKDTEYLLSLTHYAKNKARFALLEHDLSAFKSALKKDELVYIGTRLHGGILALNHGVESLIISIDNRAREMAKDIHLPVVERNELDLVDRWINGEKIFKQEHVTLPLQNIERWKTQFA